MAELINTHKGTVYAQRNGVLIPVNTNGLVGYWPMTQGSGGTAYDESKNGNDGTLNNGPVWTSTANGKALDFDGVDDYVDVGNSLNLSSEFTIAAWVKFNDLNQGHVMVAKGYDGNYVQYNHRYYNDEFCFTTYDGSVNKGSCTSDSWSTGTWYHLVGSYDGSWHTYRDAVEDSNELLDINANPNFNDRNTYIGAFDNNGSPGALYNGTMDEVRIYNRVLSAQEITNIYEKTRELYGV